MANYKLKYAGPKIDELLDKINDLEMNNYYTKVATDELLAGKQDKLTFGSGLSLSESTLSIDDTVVATKAFVGETYATKQDLETIKRNAITLVDTTEYLTLEDFLESTGEEGIVYWYPIDTTDLTKGYHTYVWETNGYIPAGDTTLDLSNYGALSANNTWTGSNTFNTKLNAEGGIDTWQIIRQGVQRLYFGQWTSDVGSRTIYPLTDTSSLGKTGSYWSEGFIGKIIDTNGSYSSNNVLNIINVSEMADSTHFTDEQFNTICNGKITYVNGTLLNFKNPIIFNIYKDAGNVNYIYPVIFGSKTNTYQSKVCELSQLKVGCTSGNHGITIQESDRSWLALYQVASINGQNIPLYPNNPTVDQLLTYTTGNQLAYQSLVTLLTGISGYDATKMQSIKNVQGVISWVDD